MLAGIQRKGNSCGLLDSTAIMENNMETIEKTKISATICSTSSTAGYISKEDEIIIKEILALPCLL
jgi:hypothetical protein